MASATAPCTRRKRQPYAATACHFCRRRKKRCNRESFHGQCTECARYGVACTPADTARTLTSRSISPLSLHMLIPPMSASPVDYYSPTTPLFMPLNSAQSILTITQSTATYARTFFDVIRHGRYFYHEYINEADFWNQYDQVVMQQCDADVAWNMLIAPVIFIGARFGRDFASAAEADRVATDSASFLVTHYEIVKKWPVHRRVHAYRGLLLYGYTTRVLNQYDELPFLYLATARHILDDPQVAEMVPSSVVRMSNLIPQFTIHRLIACTPPPTASRQSDDEWLTFSQCKYLKLKRLLRDELCIPNDDSELELGCEYDERTDIADDLRMDDIQYEMSEVTYHITYTLATDFREPLSFDPYWALFILIKAERSAVTERKAFINDYKAIIYQVLGKKVLSVRAARRTIRHCLLLEQTNEYSPPIFPLTRAVHILVEWDDAIDAPFFIKNAIRILIKITAVIGSLRPELPILSTALQNKVGEHEHRLAQVVRNSRIALEHQVFKNMNRELQPELTQAAAELVERNQQFQRIQEIKHIVERSDVIFRTTSATVFTTSSSSTSTTTMSTPITNAPTPVILDV